MKQVFYGALLGAVACGGPIEEGDLAQLRAEAECAKMEVCEQGRWESEYSGPEDCVSTKSDKLQEDFDDLQKADCGYDAEEAGRCVGRIRGMDCQEWSLVGPGAACDLVYDCGQETQP